MEIAFVRRSLVSALSSRNYFTVLIQNIRTATGIAASQETQEAVLGKKPLSEASVAAEKSKELKHNASESKKNILETKTAKGTAKDSAAETEQPISSVVDKASQLPLESGEAAVLPHQDGEKLVSERILRLANEIASLTIFEVADLNSTLKKKLNLPDAPVFAQNFAATVTPPTEGEATEEKLQPSQKTFFSVKLTKIDDSKKIPLIKEIRTLIEGFNLVQAKKFVEALPATVKEDMSKNEAEELKTKLQNLGAVCEIV